MTSEAPHPLRLIHTSDWHIGQELHGHDRAGEHDAFFVWLIEKLVQLEADALIVTGDIFDVANPPISAMARFYRFLRDATERCPALEIVVVGGNHDSAARINLPGALLGKGRVHLIGQVPRCEGLLDLEALLVPLTNRLGKTAAWLAAVPYCRPGDLGKGNLASLYTEVTDAGAMRADGLPLVLTGHLHVAGGDLSIESERRIVIGGEEAQASSLFDARAAYVALGHLHRPQAITGETLIRYAGSPFPMSVSERHYRHSISVVDLGAEGATVSEVQIPRVAQFLIFPPEGAVCLDEVERQIGSFDFGHTESPGGMPFVEVAVLLDRPEPGVTARVQAALDGKPVRLTRVRSVYPEGRIAGGIAPGQDMLDAIIPDAVFAELHTQRHAGPPEAALARAFAELLIEVETENTL